MEKAEGKLLKDYGIDKFNGKLSPKKEGKIFAAIERTIRFVNRRSSLLQGDPNPGNWLIEELPSGALHVNMIDFGWVTFQSAALIDGSLTTMHMKWNLLLDELATNGG